jgi:uncharacterized protein (TIGR04562 family)
MASSLWTHEWQPLNLAISGESIVDFPRLDISNINDAKTFLSAYGYNAEDPVIREEIWRIYFEALHFIRNVLLEGTESIPTTFFERNNQNDVLKQVTIGDTVGADKVFDVLMGSDVPSRKSFIQSNATKANLDI